jgi:pimeloyl-ACP methyl ester carboxylesterase
VLEFRHSIIPLTAPADTALPAFHLVVPALPGYGFSAKPTPPGWDYFRTANAWAELMQRLGYADGENGWLAQGGDWGADVTAVLGHLAPKGLRAVHMNSIFMDATKELVKPCIRDLDGELRAKTLWDKWCVEERAYFLQQGTRPQTLGYGLADSPVGLAAWMFEKYRRWTWQPSGDDVWDVFSKDDMLDSIMLYWLTNSGTSSARYYWEAQEDSTAWKIDMPVGVSWFPGDPSYGPKEWCERYYSNIVHWKEMEKGGHFAAWEVPDIFVAELREWAEKID